MRGRRVKLAGLHSANSFSSTTAIIPEQSRKRK
nr:MAG TPA: hypothetical protein [Bacteriophage sp.]